jgi:hypothetical protein
MSRDVAFLDTETTGVGPDRRIWEIAVIRGTRERVWVVTDVDLTSADPDSLKFGGFYKRHSALATGPDEVSGTRYLHEADVAREVAAHLDGCTVFAAIPEFDLVPLAAMLRRHGQEPSWHYRSRCIESFVAGRFGEDVGGLQQCVKALHLDPADYAGHTALGDARMVRDCWLMVHFGVEPDGRPAREILRLATQHFWQEQNEDPAEARAAFDRGPRGVTTMPQFGLPFPRSH